MTRYNVVNPLVSDAVGSATRVVANTSIIITPKMPLSVVNFEGEPNSAIMRLLIMKMLAPIIWSALSSDYSPDPVSARLSANKTDPITSR